MSGTGQAPLTPGPSTDIKPQDDYRRQSQDSDFSRFTIGAPAMSHPSSPHKRNNSTGGSSAARQQQASGSPAHRALAPSLPSPTSPSFISGLENSAHRRSSLPRNGMTPSTLLGGPNTRLAPATQLTNRPTVYLKEPPKPPAHIIQHTNYRKRQPSNSSGEQDQTKGSSSKKRKLKFTDDDDEDDDDDDEYEEKQSKAPRKPMQRKTAHSEIERNRRVKMNTASDKLADLIPATKGRQQTKLNILEQAVKYIEYLHECMDKLKDQVNIVEGKETGPSSTPPHTAFGTQNDLINEASYNEGEDIGRDVSSNFERSEGLVDNSPRDHHDQHFGHPGEAMNYHAHDRRGYYDGHASTNDSYPQYAPYSYNKDGPGNGDYNSMNFPCYSAPSSASSHYSPHSRSPAPSTGYPHHQLPQNQAQQQQQSSAADPKYVEGGYTEQQEASEALISMKNSTGSNQGTMPLSDMLS